jgi:Tol biopolymer transport system component
MTLAMALVIGASIASAAPKEIAFECGFDICLLDPDNPSDVFNLTDNGATSYDEDPVWSPDGKRLAFVANFSTTFPQVENIYTMEPEAPGQTFNVAVQITHFTDHLATDEIAWSPDGMKLAFTRGNFSYGSNTLYVVNADGSSANATAIPTVGGAAHPTFSADSGKIAFADSAKRIYTVNSDLSSPATLLPGATGREPVWSPDGSKIAYGREYVDMNIIAASGGSPLAIPFGSNFAFASWSPSGAQLAYWEQPGSAQFRVVNSDGAGNHPIPIVAGTTVSGGPASWSPDASRLVFEGAFLNNPSTSEDDVHNVYIANADGSGVATSISPGEPYGTEPAWKPNPVAHPGPQVITPSGGSSGPLQGPTIKPKLKWFTNRIFYSEGSPPYVPMLIVACGGPVCNAGGTGTSKASVAAGIRPRPALAARASSKPKTAKGPKTIVVAKGKVHVPAGQERVLKLKLTKLAIAILEKVGKLKMSVTVTTTLAGQAPTKETRSVTIIFKPKKATKH